MDVSSSSLGVPSDTTGTFVTTGTGPRGSGNSAPVSVLESTHRRHFLIVHTVKHPGGGEPGTRPDGLTTFISVDLSRESDVINFYLCLVQDRTT